MSGIVLMSLLMAKPASAFWLFKDGKSDYSIQLPASASLTERTAAAELQQVLAEISGIKLPIVADAGTGRHIHVGWSSRTGRQKPAAADEGYTYETIGDDLYIYGGSERGTMYGVFSFLERELGVHWLTSSCTRIPKKSNCQLGSLRHSEQPVVRQRLDFYNDALWHHDWAAHNKINTQYLLAQNKYGSFSAYWGIHTFQTLIPPEKYFKDHPEYFSVFNGKRSDKAQLCLSNSAMRQELTRNFLAAIKNNPGYWCYDLSQNDNPWPCECDDCKKLAERYGGQSGALLWLVNQVAGEVEKVFPDKYVGTFAYKYTRHAPTSGIRPRKNVVIRLCNIECCMAHPLESCPENESFIADMNNWQKLGSNIYIWDYSTCFRHYLLPFPNFKTMAANFRYFSRSNVIGVMEEGCHNVRWGEFSELKQWMIAKLLWNPYQNVDSLAAIFIDGYYGNSAPYVRRYYELCNRSVKPDTHFTINIHERLSLYNDRFVNSGLSLMRKALSKAVGDEELQKRILRLKAQLLYLKMYQNPARSIADGTVAELKDIINADETKVSESLNTVDKVLLNMGYR